MRAGARLLLWLAALVSIPAVTSTRALAQPAGAYVVTAYCQQGTTKAGVRVTRGIAAADPAHLPIGSVIRVDAASSRDAGIYTVLDTGSKVIGRHVDLFVPDCGRAKRFGRQLLRILVLRFGWDPKASASAEFTPR